MSRLEYGVPLPGGGERRVSAALVGLVDGRGVHVPGSPLQLAVGDALPFVLDWLEQIAQAANEMLEGRDRVSVRVIPDEEAAARIEAGEAYEVRQLLAVAEA